MKRNMARFIMMACITLLAITLPSIAFGAPCDRVNGEMTTLQDVAYYKYLGPPLWWEVTFPVDFQMRFVATEATVRSPESGLIEFGYVCKACENCLLGGWHATQSIGVHNVIIEPGVARFNLNNSSATLYTFYDGGGDYTTDGWTENAGSIKHPLAGNINIHIAR